MWPKPVIFISAGSQDFRSARDLVTKTVVISYASRWFEQLALPS